MDADVSREGSTAGAEACADGGRRALSAGTPARRVLVVDDNVDSADSLTMLLRLEGYDVIVAYGGREALGGGGVRIPDFVLLDINMPVMDGYEVARRLRQRPGGELARIVALTGWVTADARQRTHAAGFNDHFIKPLDLDALRELLAADPVPPPGS
jgi:CheY-like chemotaxis protein